MKIGLTEILVVFIVALFVIGPDKMPEYAKKFGEALKQFRKISGEATKEIRESVVEPLEEAQRPLREAMEPVTDLEKEIRDDVNGIKKSFSDIGKPKKDKASKGKASESDQAEEAVGTQPDTSDAAPQAASVGTAASAGDPTSPCETEANTDIQSASSVSDPPLNGSAAADTKGEAMSVEEATA